MSTIRQRFILVLAVVLFGQSALHGQSMKFSAKAALGDKYEKVDLLLLDRKLVVASKATTQEFAYDAITSLTYSYTKQPRGKAAVGVGILCIPCGVGLAFTKKKRHWLTIEADGIGAAALQLTKKNWQQAASQIDAKSPNVELERIEQ